MLADKCIVVGISGGIAAYKVPDLVSRLTKAGADVHCIMTQSAEHFVTSLALQTVSRNPVTTQMFETPKDWDVRHISLADRADMLVVVPATANVIGKISAGIADDMLSTTIMAVQAPVLFAPAMNVHMYQNPIVQDNIARLITYGYHFLEPDTGRLACGYEGKGRLPDIDVIFNKIESFFNTEKILTGKTYLITAGPTREFVDPVRFLTNRSTGKMGYALARAASDRGARVILISGPVNIPVPDGVEHIPVISAADMFEAVRNYYQHADVIIKAAAVADYTPKTKSDIKLKKGEGDLSLELSRTTDILRYLGENKGRRILVGFAAETDHVVENAVKKVRNKNLDLIVANDITVPGAGFGTDTNVVKLLYRDGRVEELEKMSKDKVAYSILDRIVSLQ